jgi:hypothetical protein
VDLLSQRLHQLEKELREHHRRNSKTARTDPQKSGHATEGIWVHVIQQMLPPGYRVLTRKYMTTEVDIIVLPPTAPAFYDEAEVTDIPPRIASAVIHVKNTLNKPELRDAMKRVHVVNAGTPQYCSNPARERDGMPSAIVALGSTWVGGFASFQTAFFDILRKELPPEHPAQIPGFVGTPDWDMNNITTDFCPPPSPFSMSYQQTDPRWSEPHVLKLVAGEPSGRPVHSFVQWLYSACASSDPSLEPMRVALTQQLAVGGTSFPFPFERSKVYSQARLDS